MLTSRNTFSVLLNSFLKNKSFDINERCHLTREELDKENNDLAEGFASKHMKENTHLIHIKYNGHMSNEDANSGRRIRRHLFVAIYHHVLMLLRMSERNSDLVTENFIVDSLPASCETCDSHLSVYYNFDTNIIKLLTSNEINDSLKNRTKVSDIQPPQCLVNHGELILHKNIIHVPSGRLVIADDLRKYLISDFRNEDNPILDFYRTKSKFKHVAKHQDETRLMHKPPSTNSSLGVYVFEEFYSSLNVGNAMIGNSCPSIFQNKEDGYLSFRTDFSEIETECECYFDMITSDQYSNSDSDFDCECGADEGYEHDLSQYPTHFDLNKEICVGTVITDLWCVMAIDYNLLADKMKNLGFNIEEELKKNPSFNVIDVDSGDYTFSSYMELNASDKYGAQVYATMVKTQ